MEGRRLTRGRQRIPMQLIGNQDDLYATFSKRRLGVFKKATELCSLCDVDIGIIMFSPTDNPYSFFHPSMDNVVSRSVDPLHQSSDYDRIIDSHTRGKVHSMNRELDRILAAKEFERERYQRAMDEVNSRDLWMRQPLESLTREQALVWRAWFREFKARVNRRIDQIKNQASSSALPPLPPPEAGEDLDIPDGAEDHLLQGQTSNDPYYYLLSPGVGAPGYNPYPDVGGQFYVPLPPQDFSGGDVGQNQFYVPLLPPDFSLVGDGDVHGQVYAPFHPPPPPPGSASNQDEAGPSNQKGDDV